MNQRNGKSEVLIDTNIFLRVFVKESRQMFEECKQFLQLISQGGMAAYTNTVVLIEVQFVLTSVYHKPREKVKEALEAILSMSTLKIIDDMDAQLALSFYGKTTVKFTDCLIASSKRIQLGEARLVSYDRDFDKLGVTRLEPSKLITRVSKN